VRIHCRENPVTQPLPSNGPDIVDVVTGRYLKTGVCLSAYCIATAVLIIRFVVSAKQRVYTPHYLSES
jgi:hypothetical protein